MMELIENQRIGGNPENIGTVNLSRKGGTLKLVYKSALLENYFRTVSRGETFLPKADKVFGQKLYKVEVDEVAEREFLTDTGCLLSSTDAFYGNSGGQTWFNISFLRAVGAGEGVVIPVQSMLPLKLVENGVFAKALRSGISKLLREFIIDYDVQLDFSYRSRVE